ncbi:MAG TPA: histone deacetylase family protein [Gammaproteobacteria bacterium]|nr:histone deacetylase family protein [Gammaproteobacteria bacterium]
MNTAYITHPVCEQHEMGHFHPESPHRLEAIQNRLMASPLWQLLTHFEAPSVTREQLERVHEPGYLNQLDSLSPSEGMVSLDPDTFMNTHSLEAARRAAGAAVLATDLVMQGQAGNAFCAVRPPGHHAERNAAMGFCFYNNVACAVAHALAVHGLERVAIADFDVHHGNGTEHIFAHDERVLLCSSFQHPFYPFTPIDQDIANIVHTPLSAGAGGTEFRRSVKARWLPAMEAFKPQMLFVSAGFDAHTADPMAQLNFEESDYVWVTETLMDIAQRHAAGRIVSVLEGGYNLLALARCTEVHLRTLAHVHSG